MNKKTVRTYSIKIEGFTLKGFKDFVFEYNILLGAHTTGDTYLMAKHWPYLSWEKDRQQWSITQDAVMELLPNKYYN